MSARLLLSALLGSALVCGPAANAQEGVHKCRGPGATPIYQDRPCPPGRTLRDLDADPATVSVIPFEFPHVRPAPAKPVRPPPPKRAEKGKARGEVSERLHLREGMSDGEVLARLGPPDLQAGKTGRKMRWTYLPAPGDPQTVTLVRFDEGRVVAVERTTLR